MPQEGRRLEGWELERRAAEGLACHPGPRPVSGGNLVSQLAGRYFLYVNHNSKYLKDWATICIIPPEVYFFNVPTSFSLDYDPRGQKHNCMADIILIPQ